MATITIAINLLKCMCCITYFANLSSHCYIMNFLDLFYNKVAFVNNPTDKHFYLSKVNTKAKLCHTVSMWNQQSRKFEIRLNPTVKSG